MFGICRNYYFPDEVSAKMRLFRRGRSPATAATWTCVDTRKRTRYDYDCEILKNRKCDLGNFKTKNPNRKSGLFRLLIYSITNHQHNVTD